MIAENHAPRFDATPLRDGFIPAVLKPILEKEGD
jgi:hypothetical protein